jgi:hypothetical protein
MKTVMKYAAELGLRKSIGVIVAAALTAAAVSGWVKSTMFTTNAANADGPSQVGSTFGNGHYELPPLW